MSTGELLTLIAAVAAAIVTIINAFANGWGRKAAKDLAETNQAEAVSKLDVIHNSTNGNLSKVTSQLDTALSRIDKLETILGQIATTKAATGATHTGA